MQEGEQRSRARRHSPGLAPFPMVGLVSDVGRTGAEPTPRRSSMGKRILAVGARVCALVPWAEAQEVKVGVNLPYTGIGAEFAQLVDRGMELYLKLNADRVKPYKVTLIKRDVKDPGGANAKIAVQELLTQENVDVLAGWIYSPNAIASA